MIRNSQHAERRLDGDPSRNVYLLPQRQNFRFERCPRPKQICDHPNNEPDKISHPQQHRPILDQLLVRLSLRQGQGSTLGRLFTSKLQI
jgi:hypothetical protein